MIRKIFLFLFLINFTFAITFKQFLMQYSKTHNFNVVYTAKCDPLFIFNTSSFSLPLVNRSISCLQISFKDNTLFVTPPYPLTFVFSSSTPLNLTPIQDLKDPSIVSFTSFSIVVNTTPFKYYNFYLPFFKSLQIHSSPIIVK